MTSVLDDILGKPHTPWAHAIRVSLPEFLVCVTAVLLSASAVAWAGHCCFIAGRGPWCGATLKLEVLLKAPVAVGATLLVVGKVLERTPTKGGKTKVKIGASLEDGCSPAPGVAPTVYAEMTGLSIEGVRLPSSVPHDDVDEGSWEASQAEVGRTSSHMIRLRAMTRSMTRSGRTHERL